MRTWSIPVGRFFGVEFRAHISFVLLLLFLWTLQAGDKAPTFAPSRGIALLMLILVSVIVHEVAHVLVAMQQKRRARVVILLPIGGVPLFDEQQEGRPVTVAQETIAALAGPAMSLALALFGAAFVYGVLPEAQIFGLPLVHPLNLPRSFVWVNACIAALNLLPAYPLDGGRILRAVLARRRELLLATRYAVSVSQAFAMAFIFGGVWNTWLMFTGFLLFLGAQMEERTSMFQAVLANVRMEDIMLTDFATLSPADTLEDALSKSVHSLQDDFPVVRGGDMVGIVSRQKILDALKAEGNAYVQAVMSKAFHIAQKQETLASVFRKIATGRSGLIPVVDEGRLVGIVTMQNLMHSMNLLAESRRLRRVTSE